MSTQDAVIPCNAPVVGEELISPAGLCGLKLINHGGKVRLSYLKVEGQPFSEVVRADIQENAGTVWDIQLQTPSARPVKQGDVLLATIYMRTEHSSEETGEGQAVFVFELASVPWTKYMQYPMRAGSTWKKIAIPFVAGHSHAAGETQVTMQLGFTPQIIEIGGLSVENFQKQLSLADLPKIQITYPGMASDASWRKVADERIDRIRKGSLRVVVKDEAGEPVPDATVSVKLVKHAFAFGTCVPSEILVSGANDEFNRIVPELFNIATLENDLKWEPLSGDWGPDFTVDRAKQGIKWLSERGLSVRGHTLVWPGWSHVPEFLRQYNDQPARLREEVRRHLREVVSAMGDSVVHWDVVNEPFDNHDILDILGQEVMVDWFKEVHSVQPSVKLFINDYGILSGGSSNASHRDHYEHTINMLLEKGAPLDGIGMQGHFDNLLTGPDDMLAILDRYAKFGLPIWVTEYDVAIQDEEVCGNFARDFYTVLFSHPSVEGIVMWGFWDGAHWKDNAVMYRQDWTLKPSGEAIRELLLKTWNTTEQGMTDAQGTFTTRGFLGDYVIEVGVSGNTQLTNAQLKVEGTEILVVMD